MTRADRPRSRLPSPATCPVLAQLPPDGGCSRTRPDKGSRVVLGPARGRRRATRGRRRAARAATAAAAKWTPFSVDGGKARRRSGRSRRSGPGPRAGRGRASPGHDRGGARAVVAEAGAAPALVAGDVRFLGLQLLVAAPRAASLAGSRPRSGPRRAPSSTRLTGPMAASPRYSALSSRSRNAAWTMAALA